MKRSTEISVLTRLRQSVLALCALAAPLAPAAPPWGTPQMQPGIAAVTCSAPRYDVNYNLVTAASSFVFGLMDLRTPPPAMYGINGPTAPLWNPPMYHELSWNAEYLGLVFGTEIDADGDIYLTAGGLYTGGSFFRQYGTLGGGATSLAAAGTVYKIDRMTGVPTVFSVLPQQTTNMGAGFLTGPGLGNIAYDRDFDQFFVTNLEDGKIYRLAAAGGAPVGTAYDPLAADTGAPGMPPLPDRLWGICVYNKQVYYSVWNTGNTVAPGKIRRVDLNGTGAIDGTTDVEILTVPGSSTMAADWSTVELPTSDIEISADGKTMILGQRGQRDWGGYFAATNHPGKVFIATLTGVVWSVISGIEPGNSWGHGEGYGGVDWGMENGAQEKVIWNSSADLAWGPGPHGLQGTRPADYFPVPAIVPLCFKVPYDPSYTTNGPDWKGTGGDIDIMQEEKCMEIAVKEVRCPDAVGGSFTVTLSVTNNSPNTAVYGWFTPCPTGQLPPGAITLQPLPSGVFSLPTSIATGATGTVTAQLPATAAGRKVCFRLTLLDSSGAECCTEKICIPVPKCDCIEIRDTKITCEVTSTGLIKYTIDITILNRTNFGPTPFPIYWANFLPPAGFSPATVAPVPNPIPPGGTGVLHTCYFGMPGVLCFNLSVHAADLAICCSLENVCITLPDCTGHDDKPDTCKLESRVYCCPNAAGGPPSATANFTICNNSAVPRTYNWTANPLVDPVCTAVLAAGAFLPPGGAIGPVPPGGCVTVPITILCDHFAPGQCATFEICTSFDPAVPPVCCHSEVYRPAQGEAVLKPVAGPAPGGGLITLRPGEVKPVTVTIEGSAAGEVLTLSDELGILAFLGSDGTRRDSLAIPVLPGTRTVTFDITRYDDGTHAPDFTAIQVRRGSTPGPVLTDIPVMLINPEAGPRMVIRSFSLQDGPPPRVDLVVSTRAGYRYRVQESRNLTAWSDSACSIIGATANPDGSFNGTGGDVTCSIPCTLGTSRSFYRAVELWP